jgi:hypothetical protein
MLRTTSHLQPSYHLGINHNHLGINHHSHPQAYASPGMPVWPSLSGSDSSTVYGKLGGKADGSMLLAAANNQEVIRSTDGGRSWATVSLLKEQNKYVCCEDRLR